MSIYGRRVDEWWEKRIGGSSVSRQEADRRVLGLGLRVLVLLVIAALAVLLAVSMQATDPMSSRAVTDVVMTAESG